MTTSRLTSPSCVSSHQWCQMLWIVLTSLQHLRDVSIMLPDFTADTIDTAVQILQGGSAQATCEDLDSLEQLFETLMLDIKLEVDFVDPAVYGDGNVNVNSEPIEEESDQVVQSATDDHEGNRGFSIKEGWKTKLIRKANN